MNIYCRATKLGDVDKILKLFDELREENLQVSFSKIKDKDILLNMLNNKDMYFYVALVNNEIVGVFRGLRGEDYKKHSCFLTVAIKKSFRGNGIAKILTEYGLIELKKEGIKIARAYIYSDNRASIFNIFKLGFTMSGSVHMHHYNEKLDRYVDDLIFHKIL